MLRPLNSQTTTTTMTWNDKPTKPMMGQRNSPQWRFPLSGAPARKAKTGAARKPSAAPTTTAPQKEME
jgi:hypothetical protein